MDEDLPPVGVVPLLAPKTKQVNTKAGAPGAGGADVTNETVGLPRDWAPPASGRA